MTRGVMKHLRVLEDAELVVTRRSGREKHHFLNPVPIRLIYDAGSTSTPSPACPPSRSSRRNWRRGDDDHHGADDAGVRRIKAVSHPVVGEITLDWNASPRTPSPTSSSSSTAAGPGSRSERGLGAWAAKNIALPLWAAFRGTPSLSPRH
jgi:DNA-binding transcriptional ArsR family regulator